VDAVGSVIFGGEKKSRLIPGHGAAVRPALYQPELAVECVMVSDVDCVLGCRRLVKQEAILAGGSSGAVVTAVGRVKGRFPAGATCVLILADRGERYLDTIYSDEWVLEHFGEVSQLWQDSVGEETCVAATL
jgi:cysteine synthase A